MSYICANPRCRDHIPMPSGLPDDADVVRVIDPEPLSTRPWRDGDAATRAVPTRLVHRHLYRNTDRRWYDFYLCDACHAAQQAKGN